MMLTEWQLKLLHRLTEPRKFRTAARFLEREDIVLIKCILSCSNPPTDKTIADMFGTTRPTVSRIAREHTHGHIKVHGFSPRATKKFLSEETKATVMKMIAEGEGSSTISGATGVSRTHVNRLRRKSKT